MCKVCVAEGLMTQADLDKANSTDSDQADYSGISGPMAEQILKGVREMLSPKDPDTEAQATMDKVRDEAIEMVKAYAVDGKRMVPDGTDPNSPVGVATILGYVATQVAYFQGGGEMASMVAVLAHEVGVLDEALGTLTEANAKAATQAAERVNHLNARGDAAWASVADYQDKITSIRNALPSDMKDVYLKPEWLDLT